MLLLITNSLLFYILWSSSNAMSINLSKFPHTAKVWTAEQRIHYFPWKIYFRYLSSFSKSITEDVKTPVIIQRYMHNCIQIFRYIYLFANSTSLYKIFHMQGDQFFLNPSSYFPYSSNSIYELDPIFTVRDIQIKRRFPYQSIVVITRELTKLERRKKTEAKTEYYEGMPRVDRRRWE